MSFLKATTAIERITILGATGSIGLATLKVIQSNPNLDPFALVSHKNYQKMLELIKIHRPQFVFMSDEKSYQKLKKYPFKNKPIFAESLDEVIENPNSQLVMAAIATSVGLNSTLKAIKQSKTILLANKESLVMAGNLLIDQAKKYNAQIIPVDSEHNAILQCLPSEYQLLNSDLAHDFGLEKIILTASGGAFWNNHQDQLITIKKALSHPNWSMGKKITIDSNTMVNKGLEMIEASYLFDLKPQQIQCLIHPQSIIHGLVYFQDNSVMAAMAEPDMQIAISYSIAYAIHSKTHNHQFSRVQNQSKPLDLADQHLDFFPIDDQKFPCFKLATECLNQRGSFPLFFNAANEVAVELFLAEKITFTNIEYLIGNCLNHASQQSIESIDEMNELDLYARKITKQYAEKIIN